jgi:hypothetical protein
MSLRFLSATKKIVSCSLRPPVVNANANAISVWNPLESFYKTPSSYQPQPCHALYAPAIKRHFSQKAGREPTTDIAKMMPVGISEMENETLILIAAMGDYEARTEVLKRHIMAVDDVEYDEACNKFQEIASANQGTVNINVYPYFVGIGFGMIGAIGSLPMVFNLNTALWFNEDYVTTDIPEPRDLETMLEVGSWTWNWMEPPLGTLSFALLCLQFAR